jgi:hypothetical protein
MTLADRWDHLLARFAVRRMDHRVEPGLYALGSPTRQSPVLVTANYSLSFDALRESLAGRDAYILVLETRAINVWCAAGKGTFGTDELVARIAAVDLPGKVDTRTLILPQLGAPGVCAQDVERRTGFRVEYGPVRAADLPAYLAAGGATAEMRRVSFTLRDRLVLIPVEAVSVLLPTLLVALVMLALRGSLAAAAVVASVAAGVILFPLLLPWLPTREFSTKGFFLGGVAALPFAVRALPGGVWGSLSYLLWMPAVTAFIALNFTGATPLASRSGVKCEMKSYIRPMALMAAAGLLLVLITALGGRAG